MDGQAIALLVPIGAMVLVFAYLAGFFFVRYRQLQVAAAASQNPAIIYTIPTNAPSSTPQRPNSLFPSRPTSYYAHSTDLPPSYEDVTKDSPVVVILPMAEDTAPTSIQATSATTTSHAPATIVPTNTSTTTASA